jgi:ADP-heptose:LPS heptosyltransferase
MNWKISSLKGFDSIFGRLACSVAMATVKPRKDVIRFVKSPSHKSASSEKIKILVIRPGGIGDAALLYPALKALRESFKDSQINVLAEQRNAGILKGCPYINSVFLYDFRPPIELFKTILANYDIVIDTEQWHRLTATASYLTRAPIRVGFVTNERAKLFTHPVPYSHDDYEVYSFLNLVSGVTGIRYDFNENEPFLPLDSNLISQICPAMLEFRKKWGATVGVFAGATIPERRWGMGNFAETSKTLSQEGIGTVIVGGRVDLKDAKKFEENVGRERILNFVGKTSLIETAAIISQVDLFLTGDTGLMHIAYGVGTPTVSLFGAGIQRKWAPIGKNHIAINKDLFCSPCTKYGYTPRCPYSVKCLKDITIDEVKEATLRLLSQSKK